MNRNKKQQAQGKQRSAEQKSQERKEKQLTLEDLALVSGGAPRMRVKMMEEEHLLIKGDEID